MDKSDKIEDVSANGKNWEMIRRQFLKNMELPKCKDINKK